MLTFSFFVGDNNLATNTGKQQEWVNINQFTAKLSATKVPQFNQLSRGGFVLRDTLENVSIDSKELDGLVPAAAVWIKIVGKEIYQSEGTMEGEYDYITSDWKGEKGWSKARWVFWRERFTTMGKSEALSETTRDVANEAAELMKKIEKEA